MLLTVLLTQYQITQITSSYQITLILDFLNETILTSCPVFNSKMLRLDLHMLLWRASITPNLPECVVHYYTLQNKSLRPLEKWQKNMQQEEMLVRQSISWHAVY